jgi:hypothetical protein
MISNSSRAGTALEGPAEVEAAMGVIKTVKPCTWSPYEVTAYEVTA